VGNRAGFVRDPRTPRSERRRRHTLPTIGEMIAYGGNVTVYLTDDGVIFVDLRTGPMHDFIVEQMRSLIERVRTLTRQGESREAIAEALLAEFNWGGGLAAGIIPNMMQELR
jgi:hypothetical protein